ncbi:hypothetical protein ADIS_3473 [Lunatimonas lonarensis]|uniref:TonB C-terminal domain-containing protein n=1 Tax=Lunatimonas lonarensis TaxID=1232681 RepID=R7ZQF6_9BACT|nr:energy transducer TonB [Lunatimonas lonarensis]EON76345.1 hypothetical protein ADIS_3473 [Lunatimonas lonarensis]
MNLSTETLYSSAPRALMYLGKTRPWLACLTGIWLVSLVFCTPTQAQKKSTPLNAHGFEIKNTKKYTACSFRTTLIESDGYLKTAVYDTLGQLKSVSECWSTKRKKEWVTERDLTIRFTSEGDTASVSDHTLAGKSDRLLFYEDGLLFAEAIMYNGKFKEGWQLNDDGDRIPMDEVRQIPRLSQQEIFYRYLAKEIRYPKEARQKGLVGVVYLAFDMDDSGRLRSIEVANPEAVDPILIEEALRVVSAYPLTFEPMEDRYGNPKEGILRLPIRFAL